MDDLAHLTQPKPRHGQQSARPGRERRGAQLASASNVGHASRLPGRAKRGLGGANAAPFGAAGQVGRLPYIPDATSTVVVLPSCVQRRVLWIYDLAQHASSEHFTIQSQELKQRLVQAKFSNEF